MHRLYKDEASGGGGCPGIYLDSDGSFVIVGQPASTAGITDLLPGEAAVRVPEEVPLGGVEEYLGRPVRRDATSIQPFSPAWDAMLADFEHTAFRLEVLQHYAVGYEDSPLERFLAGEPRPSAPVLDDWNALVRTATAASKRMQRVHVVIEPLTPYLRYELTWAYADNIEAGEDIRILPVREGEWPAGLPRHDFWLYDSSRVGVLHYDPEGHLYRAELVRDPAEVIRHVAWRDLALHHAIPWDVYMVRFPGLRARLKREREKAGQLPTRA
jgi:Family of unknown function (DUF6879)